MSRVKGKFAPDMSGAGARIKEERTRLGISQLAFAAALGVDPKTQRVYEAGLSSPGVGYLTGLAAVGVDVLYVLTGRREIDAEPQAGHLKLERLPGFGPADGPFHILLPDFLVQRKIGIVPIENVRWAINPSNSMEPEIPQHAVVMVDTTMTSLTDVVDGGAYAYALWGSPNIRRFLNRRDHWSIVGFGKSPEHTPIYKDDPDSGLELFGPVIAVL